MLKRLPLPFIGKRLALLPLLLFVAATLTFIILHALPGNPGADIAGEFANPKTIAQINARLGIGQPIWTEYGNFLYGVIHWNLGTSYFDTTSVTSDIGSKLPSDIELLVISVAVALIWGLFVGVIGAWWRRRLPDSITRVIVSIQQAIPDFVLGLVMIFIFAFRLKWLPLAVGQLAIGVPIPPHHTGAILLDAAISGQWNTFGDAILHLILPVLAMASTMAAVVARVTRSSLGAALQAPTIEFARSCGLKKRTQLRYALMSSRTVILTYVAVLLSAFIGAMAIIETVFNWNGLASYGVTAINQKDIPVVQGYVLVTCMIALVIYITLDVVVGLLDPRIRNA